MAIRDMHWFSLKDVMYELLYNQPVGSTVPFDIPNNLLDVDICNPNIFPIGVGFKELISDYGLLLNDKLDSRYHISDKPDPNLISLKEFRNYNREYGHFIYKQNSPKYRDTGGYLQNIAIWKSIGDEITNPYEGQIDNIALVVDGFEGWRIPRRSDWMKLINYYNTTFSYPQNDLTHAGYYMKQKSNLQIANKWALPNNAISDYENNINLLASGRISIYGGEPNLTPGYIGRYLVSPEMYYEHDFLDVGWKTRDDEIFENVEEITTNDWLIRFKVMTLSLNKDTTEVKFEYDKQDVLYSIRLVKDTVAIIPEDYLDSEGHSYKTITIGNQTWMAEDLQIQNIGDGFYKEYGSTDNKVLKCSIIPDFRKDMFYPPLINTPPFHEVEMPIDLFGEHDSNFFPFDYDYVFYHYPHKGYTIRPFVNNGGFQF